MSFRKDPDNLQRIVQDIDRRLRSLEKGLDQGSRWNRNCSSFGCIEFVSPVSDFGGTDVLQVRYKFTPIWPSEPGYPGVRVERTVENLTLNTSTTTQTVISV